MQLMKLNIQLFADGKVVIETDLDNKGFKSGLDKMQSIAKTGFKTVATSVGVVSTAMAGLIGFGVKYNAEIEQLQTSFEVMTGSAEKAKDIIKELQEIGAETPFEVKDLAKATNLLMSFGFGAEDAIDSMLMLGDIAQGSSEKLDTISKAYGRMVSSQKVTLEDMNMMIDSGFNPLQIIVENTGESMKSLYDRISKGTMSVEEITEAMKQATSEGGKYFQSMEKQSKTLNGQISTLKDNFSMFAGVLAEDTTNAITSEFLPAINDTIQSMQEAFSEDGFEGLAEAFAEGFTNILLMLVEKAPEVINVAVIMIQTFITAIQENLPMIINSAIQIITTLVQGILTMLPQILQMGIQIIVQLIQGIAQQAPTLIPQTIDCIMLMVDTIIDNLDLIIEAGIELILALALGIVDAIPKLLEKLPEIIVKIVTKLTEPEMLSKLIGAALTLIIALAGGLIKAIPELISVVPRLITELVSEFINKIKNTDWKEVGKNLVEGLWNGIKSVKDWILDKISGFVDSIVGGIKKFFGIASPSKLMRDEVGKFVAQGIGVGFENELSNVYDDMQKAVDLETEKMSATVQTGNIYNKVMNTTPVQVNGTYTSTLEVNGEVLAEVVNDVNDKKDLQYMF